MSYILYSVLLTYLLWVFYVAVMHLKIVRDRGDLKGFSKPLAFVTLVIGYAIDFACNVLVFSALLIELPRETTVTARLTRHLKAGGWRGRIAQWFGDHLLNAYDPSGNHLD